MINKNRIVIPILIVILIIILILSYGVLFGKKSLEKENGEFKEIEATIIPVSVSMTPVQNSETDDFIEEFNTAERVEYKYTMSDGEVYSIKIPIGIEPPSQTVVEKMYRIEKNQ